METPSPKYIVRRRNGTGGRDEKWELDEETLLKWFSERKIDPMDEIYEPDSKMWGYARYFNLNTHKDRATKESNKGQPSDTDLESQKRRAFVEIEKEAIENGKNYRSDVLDVNLMKVSWLAARAKHLWSSENLDSALSDLNEAIQLRPDDSPTYIALSIAYRIRHDFKSAIEILQRAPSGEHRNDFDMLLQMIEIYLEMGDKEMALSAAEKALVAAESPIRKEYQRILKLSKVVGHTAKDEEAVKRIEVLIKVLKQHDNGKYIRADSDLADRLDYVHIMRQHIRLQLGLVSDNMGKKILSAFLATVWMTKSLHTKLKSEVESLRHISAESDRSLFEILFSIMYFQSQIFFWEQIISDQILKCIFQDFSGTYHQQYIYDPAPLIRECIDNVGKLDGIAEYDFIGSKVCDDIIKTKSKALTKQIANICSHHFATEMIPHLEYAWKQSGKELDDICDNVEIYLWRLDIPYFSTGNQRLLRTILEQFE